MAPVPSKLDPCWAKALTGPAPQVTSLATRLLIARLRDDVSRDPGRLADSVAQLQAFFVANAFAVRDLEALQGRLAHA
jgi:hypothetical protein